MSAIVKPNANLAAGGYEILRRVVTTSESGEVVYSVDLCCLQQFASNYMQQFRRGSDPFMGLSQEILLLDLRDTPTLDQFSYETFSGITYFYPKYTGALSGAFTDESELTTTISTQQRSFSASASGIVQVGTSSFNVSAEQIVTLQFDYISTTVTVAARAAGLGFPQRGSVGGPFNIRQTSNLSAPIFRGSGVSVRYTSTTIEETNSVTSTKSSPVYTYSSTGIYVST